MIMMEEEYDSDASTCDYTDTLSLDEYGNPPEEDTQLYTQTPNKFENFLMIIVDFFKKMFTSCDRNVHSN